MRSRICLIRHGLTEGNLRRLYYGRTDIPLAGKGKDELERLTREGIYPDADNADLYTTGLVRTEQTFAVIYGDREHSCIDSFREIDFGDFEMKTYEELMDVPEYVTWIEDRSGSLEAPGGESLNGFTARVLRGYEELRRRHALKELTMRHKDEDVLSIVVCHGGTIAAIMDHVFPGETDNFFMWTPEPGHGYTLDIEDEKVMGHERF